MRGAAPREAGPTPRRSRLRERASASLVQASLYAQIVRVKTFVPEDGVPLNRGRAFNFRFQAPGRNDRVSLKPAFEAELLAATPGPGSGGPSQQFVCPFPRV